MPKTFKYVQQSEGVIGSYDSTDLIKGVGYIDFHGAILENVTSSSGALVTNIIYSRNVPTPTITEFDYYLPDGTWATFDIEIEQPLTIGGLAFINVPFCFYYNAGGSASLRTSINTTLERVRAGTAVSISDTSSGSYLSSTLSAGQSDFGLHAAQLNVTTTRLKKNDRLRLKIKQNSIGSPNQINAQINPKDGSYSSPTAITTIDLKLSIPFKIDL